MNCVTIHLWLDDLSERLYGPNKQKNKSFNMITGINESISLVKHFLCVCRCTLHHSVQRGINPPPPKKTPSRPFFAKPPEKDFSVNPRILKFFIHNPISIFKCN